MAEVARRPNITPTAPAERVRALENELRVRMVERSVRTVQLTGAEARVLASGRNVRREAREMKAALSEQVFAGEFRLGTIWTALTGVLPEILVLFAVRHEGRCLDRHWRPALALPPGGEQITGPCVDRRAADGAGSALTGTHAVA